jgi:hypothetical protein
VNALRHSWKVAVIAFFLMAVDVNLILLPAKIVWTLCFGWVFAAARMTGRLGEHTTNLIVWASLFLILGLATQRFCRIMAASRTARWETRWTLSGFGGLWISLLAAMALIGVVHQIGWLAISRPSWVRGNENLRLYVAAAQVSHAAKTGDWSPDEIRRVTPFDWVDLVMQHDSANNKITNVVLIHRDGRTGFIEVRPDGTSMRRPMKELKNALGVLASK